LLVNLLNTSGPHPDASVFTIGEVEPVGPHEVTVRLPKKPIRVTLDPREEKLDWHDRKGEVRLAVSRLDIPRVVVE